MSVKMARSRDKLIANVLFFAMLAGMHPSPVQLVPPHSLQPHPSAFLLPMSPEDEQALAEDIATHGILRPLDITPTYHILDGVHRWQKAEALALARIPVQVFTYPTPQEELLHAIRANVKRRHLSSSQKAMLALELEKLFAQEAKKRQKQQVVSFYYFC
jgi:ParB-like chromosome segregation protein Spo0J